MIQQILSWLRGLPGLSAVQPEALEPYPGSAGLFCQGLRELGRSADILGNATRHCRLELVLAIHDTGTAVPQALLELSCAGAPILGSRQQVNITQGRLVRADGDGLRRYEARIIFEYEV